LIEANLGGRTAMREGLHVPVLYGARVLARVHCGSSPHWQS